MHEPFDITTVIFAVLAVFVVWKLRSVLGTRTGTERPPFDPFAQRRKAREANPNAPGETGTVIRLPGAGEERSEASSRDSSERDGWKKLVAPDAVAALDGLDRIKAADRDFSPNAFVQGARQAYEMIVLAFAKGDRDALAPLLAREVFDSFSASIAEREAAGHRLDTTFVSLDKALIEDAQLRGRTAQITMRFQPKLISVTRDREDAVIDGTPDTVSDVTDLWTFARESGSSDPNWKLVVTETVN